ncbi:MAG: FtsX-like permease family protein [Roseivirga sp.]|nr:FtsX-like permease family protein [Roseivirga sp.]
MKELPEDINPPKWADRFFKWYCYAPLHESIYGDMQERYDEYLERYGLRKANRKYWLDVLRFMNRHTLKRSKNSKVNTYNPLSMLSNYLKVGFRNLLKNRSFTVINVLGLSVSMAVCLVIILMINDQLSYDNFQANKDRIYRFTHERTNGRIGLPIATVPVVLGDRMQADFAGFEHMVRFSRGFGGEILQDGKAIAINGLQTEQSFFEMFSFKLEQGNIETCLKEPNSIVLRKDIAEKLFGDKNPMGETITVDTDENYLVTGVLEAFPGKTHIEFESLVSMTGRTFSNWEGTTEGWVYFTLQEGVSMDGLEPMLTALQEEHYNEQSEYLVDFNIQKMTDITPGPLYGNQIGSSMPNFFVIGLAILALLIIICAAFNYANLSAARALTRTKEVGVRKVMGARKGHLTIQFIVESILVSLLSLVVAIGLLQFLIPAFENLQMSSLLNWDLSLEPKIYAQFIGFSVLVGLITGLFPSLYLASFRPIEAMKNAISSNKLSRVNLRKALIICQFVISLVLIVSSTLVYKQIKFMVEKDYGYTKENVINVELQGQDYEILKTELSRLPFVERISATNLIPNTGQTTNVDAKRNFTEEPVNFNYFAVDEGYIDNLNLTLVAGDNFLPTQKDGDETTIILNETGAKTLGFETALDAINEPVILGDSTRVTVAGVVKDYNYMVLYMDIKPMMFRYRPSSFRYAQVKITGFDISDEMTALEATWDKFDPNHEMIAKTFQGQIDEFNAFFYDILYIIGLVAILSITIATLGLLGIATYSIQVRLKEVSIRKVLGASSKGLILLLSKGFMYLFGIAMVIGFTLAYLGNSLWLDGFAYRVSFGVDIFLITALVMIGIGILTIGLQALRATTTNPANILRDD